MTKQDKKDIVITGRTVARAVQVLTGLFLIWELVQTMLGQQALDANNSSPVGWQFSLFRNQFAR